MLCLTPCCQRLAVTPIFERSSWMQLRGKSGSCLRLSSKSAGYQDYTERVIVAVRPAVRRLAQPPSGAFEQDVGCQDAQNLILGEIEQAQRARFPARSQVEVRYGVRQTRRATAGLRRG